MGHCTYIKTQLVERTYLLQALRDMGYAYQQADIYRHLQVRGPGGKHTRVEIKVKTNRPGHDIGFQRDGATYRVVADWLEIYQITRQEFLRRLTQRYAYHAARANLSAQGFTIIDEELQPGGQVRLVVQKMAW